MSEQGDISEPVALKQKNEEETEEKTLMTEESTCQDDRPKGKLVEANDNFTARPIEHSSLADGEKCNPAMEGMYFPLYNSSFPGEEDTDVLKYPAVTKKVFQHPKNKPKYFILTREEVIAAKKEIEEKEKETEKKKEESRVRKLKLTSASVSENKTVSKKPKQSPNRGDTNNTPVTGRQKKTHQNSLRK
jgi:hypothetical protein